MPCLADAIADSSPLVDTDGRFGSWPRDNATEEVWAALDRSVAAQLGRFEHIFSDFGLEATVVRATHPERL
jgi:hypothetical protein